MKFEAETWFDRESKLSMTIDGPKLKMSIKEIVSI